MFRRGAASATSRRAALGAVLRRLARLRPGWNAARRGAGGRAAAASPSHGGMALAAAGGAAAAVGALLLPLRAEDFFDGTFTTTKNPDDLVDFYSGEDLLKILAVHPLFVKMGLAGVEFQEDVSEGWDAATWSAKTGMEVSFALIADEEDTTGDGEPDTVAHFKRHERFINYLPGLAYFGIKVLLWEQTWNYGYKRLSDGTCEVYHHGESFRGPWPVRLIVELHQRYVLWACDKHINSPVFGSDDIEVIEEQASHVPLHVLREFVASLQRDAEHARGAVGHDAARARELDAVLAKLQQLPRRLSADSARVLESTSLSAGSGRVLNTKLAVRIDDTELREIVNSALRGVAQARTLDEARVLAAALDQLVQHPGIDLASKRWREGKSGRKTAFFASLEQADRLRVLQLAGTDVAQFTGRLGEGKVATFARLPEDVKAQALSRWQEEEEQVQRAECGAAVAC